MMKFQGQEDQLADLLQECQGMVDQKRGLKSVYRTLKYQ